MQSALRFLSGEAPVATVAYDSTASQGPHSRATFFPSASSAPCTEAIRMLHFRLLQKDDSLIPGRMPSPELKKVSFGSPAGGRQASPSLDGCPALPWGSCSIIDRLGRGFVVASAEGGGNVVASDSHHSWPAPLARPLQHHAFSSPARPGASGQQEHCLIH